MIRTLLLFLKAVVGAFFATCLFLGFAFWVLRTLRGGAELDASATAPLAGPVDRQVGPPAETAQSSAVPEAPKRSGAAKIVSALQFAENVEASKRRAVQRYPELGVKDSAVNREFIRRMRLFQSMNPGFFEEALWPEKLADLMAADLSLDSQQPEPAGVPR